MDQRHAALATLPAPQRSQTKQTKLAALLRTRRQQLGLTLEEAAAACAAVPPPHGRTRQGVSTRRQPPDTNWYKRLELGRAYVTVGELRILSQALGLPVSLLYDLADS
jgi:transcriptional regulator with XRE-family HTH domain